jgi:hypothetical protein
MTKRNKAVACWLASSFAAGVTTSIVAALFWRHGAVVGGGVVAACVASTKQFWLDRFGV